MPVGKSRTGGITQKKTAENKYYMIVCNVPVSGNLKVQPPRDWSVTKAAFMGEASKKILLEKIDYGASFIHLPKGFSIDKPFVIELEVQKTKTTGNEQKAKT